jgi:hypothetical protein
MTVRRRLTLPFVGRVDPRSGAGWGWRPCGLLSAAAAACFETHGLGMITPTPALRADPPHKGEGKNAP